MKTLLRSLPALLLSLTLAPSTFAQCTSTTDCQFTFDEHNSGFSGIVTGTPYGTVELKLIGTTISVALAMNSNLVLIKTGFDGTFGYNDNLNQATPFTVVSSLPSVYSGTANNGGTDTTASDSHFDGFGYFDDAAGTTGPHAGSSDAVSNLTFTLSRTGGFSSIQQIIEGANGGDTGLTGSPFVVDAFDKACGDSTNTACTGLLGISGGGINISSVPEPTSYLALLMGGLGAMLLVARRHRNLTAK
jgi:PEP-CTERM motif